MKMGLGPCLGFFFINVERIDIDQTLEANHTNPYRRLHLYHTNFYRQISFSHMSIKNAPVCTGQLPKATPFALVRVNGPAETALLAGNLAQPQHIVAVAREG